jgi:membrane protease YdiL (CAAX protease family)
MLAAMLAFLRQRGWQLADLNIKRTLASTVGGILFGLMLVVLWGIVVWLCFVHGLLPHPSHLISHPRPHPNSFVVVLDGLVNAYFEELTMTAYAFNQFAVKWGPSGAIAVIVILRVLFHLWKNPIYLPFTAVYFFCSALIYYRWRNLWPLILSHAFYDITLELPNSRM